MGEAGSDRGAGGHGHLRAAHADRDRAIDLLKTAFVQGMLDKDEFDQRVGQAFASRTHAELAAVTVDLPALEPLPVLEPLPAPVPREEGWLTVKRAAIISACLLVPTALATVIGVPVFDHYDETALIMLPLVAFFLATVISVPLMAEALHRRRTRPRLPQAPAPGAGSAAALESPHRRRRRSTGRRDLTLAVPA